MSYVYLRVMRSCILYFLLFACGTVFGQGSYSLPLLNTAIDVVCFGEDTSDILLYNMHDNENTSSLAGRVFGEKYAGSYYELIHTGKRNISFLYGEDSIHIDPNRIYTDTGVWKQLAKNEILDSMAYDIIAAWRDSLMAKLNIESRSLVIALHNNTKNNYGFRSYKRGKEYEDEAQALKKGAVRCKDDFYFVTDSDLFARLSTGSYNVVLQSTETLTDDGSLSVYCSQLGIPYINVEARHGHLSRQIKMLIFAYQVLIEDGEIGSEAKKKKRQQKKAYRQLLKAAKSYCPGLTFMASTICSISFKPNAVKTPD